MKDDLRKAATVARWRQRLSKYAAGQSVRGGERLAASMESGSRDPRLSTFALYLEAIGVTWAGFGEALEAVRSSEPWALEILRRDGEGGNPGDGVPEGTPAAEGGG